jgi:PhzF family phenazine biosynthesis protein
VTQPIYLVDAFATEPFAGNPAGVCPLEKEMPSAWMQSVAGEMNQAETAFLVPNEDGHLLRWFTPTTEVELCGHATLASAHILWSTGRLPIESQCRFETLSGTLPACQIGGGRIELDFPVEEAVEIDSPPDLCTALGIGSEPIAIGQNRMDYLIEIETEHELRSLRPDMGLLAAFPTRGAIVTCRSLDGYDFVSRYFAPAFGVPEDAVTGSAHCCLGPYWASKLGKNSLRAFQASKRGGSLEVEVAGDRVMLRGHAVTTLEGALRC